MLRSAVEELMRRKSELFATKVTLPWSVAIDEAARLELRRYTHAMFFHAYIVIKAEGSKARKRQAFKPC